MNCISQPINIKKNKYEVGVGNSSGSSNKNKTNIHQYGLKQNSFNPNKASPPNSWNFRLMQRICNANICNANICNANTNTIISNCLATSDDVNVQ